METSKTRTVELTDNELAEILAKLANELDIYDDMASPDLESGFVKMFKLIDHKENNCYITTLVKKFSEKLINE